MAVSRAISICCGIGDEMGKHFDPFKRYRTRFTELDYSRHAQGLWRVIATDTGQAIGPHYASKAELLTDLTRYATDYGCEGTS